MVETLEHLIRRSAEHPRIPRAALYKEILRSDTYLLTLDEPMKQEQAVKISKANDTFPIWADKDPELGGVWVPVFPSRDSVGGFVSGRKLKAPRGKEFLWMGHKPGAVFSVLRGVKCFAGVRLYLSVGCSVSLGWSEVKALAEGRIPDNTPELYEMPVAKLVLPMGARLVFGKIAAGPKEPNAKLLCLPAAGHFSADDIRRLVHLPMSSGPVWMHCVEDLLCSMIGFQMYGEAEALAEWLMKEKGGVSAWVALAAVYGRTGRYEELAALCRRACQQHPAEPSFVLTGAKALLKLERPGEARHMLEAALERMPGEAKLLEALKNLPA
jgi:hypothetical protein